MTPAMIKSETRIEISSRWGIQVFLPCWGVLVSQATFASLFVRSDFSAGKTLKKSPIS